MNKFFLSLISSTILCSCNQVSFSSINFEYDNFESRMIVWNELLDKNNEEYYVYIYSEHCGYCIQIKQDILNFLNNNFDSSYLINYSKEIPISSDCQTSIGEANLENISILGTPTLLKIVNKTLVLNIAGKYEILDYIQS